MDLLNLPVSPSTSGIDAIDIATALEVISMNPAICERILAEYREMPGMRLTIAQAARLWALDLASSEILLRSLAATGKLRHSATGQYSSPTNQDP